MKTVRSLVLVLLLLAPVVAMAQTGYLKVDDIVGGSADPGHIGWSEIDGLSWNLNTEYSGSFGGGGTGIGPADAFSVSMTMTLDKANLKFAQLQRNGRVSQIVTIELRDISQKTNAEYTFYRMRIEDAFFVENLTSWAALAQPKVTVSIRFKKILVEHFVVNAKGVTTKTGSFTADATTGY